MDCCSALPFIISARRRSSLALHRLHAGVRLPHRLHVDPVWRVRRAWWVDLNCCSNAPSRRQPPDSMTCNRVAFFQGLKLCILGSPCSSRTPSSSLGELLAALRLRFVHWLVFPHSGFPLFSSGVWSSSLDAQKICGSSTHCAVSVAS